MFDRRDPTPSSQYESNVSRQGIRVRVVFRSHMNLVLRVIEIPISPEHHTDKEITNLMIIVFMKNKACHGLYESRENIDEPSFLKFLVKCDGTRAR